MAPKFVRPCIPTTAKAIPQDDAWLHEPKLDGYRFQIVIDGRQARLYSQSGYGVGPTLGATGGGSGGHTLG